MTFFRKDIITGAEVSICPDRTKRPMDNEKKQNNCGNPVNLKNNCPFCPENKSMVIKAIDKHNSDDTNVRIVYNKYPIFTEDGELYGIHYVLIESNKHEVSPFSLSVEERIEIISGYIHAAKNLYSNKLIKYVQIFKNYKRQGGASLEHPHSQIIGISTTPLKVKIETDNLKDYYKKNNSCFYCDSIKEELKANERIVYNDGKYVAVCPYVSIYPYELRIYKLKHESSIIDFGDSEVKDLSAAINNVMKIMGNKLGDFPHNMYFKFCKENNNYFHFYIEICPRIGNFGGLETSVGINVLTITPEEAAVNLRNY